MPDIAMVGLLALVYAIVMWWCCRTLPREKWQILAAMPVVRTETGAWQGQNITYYGFFIAGAMTSALALMLLMLGALKLNVTEMAFILLPILLACVPASRLVARVVEKKPQTITVAGASFVGLLISPVLILAGDWVFDRQGSYLLPIMAALAVSNAVGEGLGRLACISFGCCYGKPLDQCPPIFQRLFNNRGFVFTGPTKKICYASGLEGQPVLPIQAITSVVNVGASLAGLYLFLKGYYAAAFLLVIIIGQGWRAYSETLRADFRGSGKLTAYQWMALVSIVFGLIVTALVPSSAIPLPSLSAGLTSLWNPALLLALEALWLAMLLYFGRSKVTGSTIHFHVVQGNI